MSQIKSKKDPAELSLLLNGPLYQFYLWTGLLKKPLLFYKRRILFICLFAWLPLFILSIFAGSAFSHVKVPFIFDIEVHVRLIVTLAILIYSEVIASELLQIVVKHFLESDILLTKDRKSFYATIASVERLTESGIIEILLIIFVLIIGPFIFYQNLPQQISTWYITKTPEMSKLTLSGYWYVFVSLPLFQFILLRWYYRLAIWYRFLWQVSRLPLQLNSLHPDRAGGLGFLTYSIYAFEPLLLAHSVLLTGIIFNRIWNMGASLPQFQAEIIGMLIFLMILPLIPLLFFMLALSNAKRIGTLEYDRLADCYVNDFKKKWIDSKPKKSESLLGNSDIQSLADLSNSFEVSLQMRITPFSKRILLQMFILTALPFIPLILTLVPIDKIIHQAMNMMF